MASFIGQLRVSLGLDANQFGAGLQAAQARMSGFEKSMVIAAARVASAFAAAFTTGAASRAADAWSDMSSRVGVAVGSMDMAPEVMKRIHEIANMTYSGLEQTAEGFIQNAASLRELGMSTSQVLDYTEALNNALVVSGAKGQRAQQVSEALSKAMATGKLSGDGLNSVLTHGGKVAELLARELGTTRNGLIKLAGNGKITADVIRKALLGAMTELQVEAESMPATIGDAFTRIGTNFTAFIGKMDKATGATSLLASGIMFVADNIGRLLTYAAAAATAFGTYMAAAFVRAQVATVSLSGALVALRGALIRTGIGALVIIAGEAAFRFGEVTQKVGGIGKAFGLLKDVAVEAWGKIVAGASAMVMSLDKAWLSMKLGFVSALRAMAQAASDFFWSMGGGDSSETPLIGAQFKSVSAAMQRAAADLAQGAEKDLYDQVEEVGGRISAAWDKALSPMESLAALREAASGAAGGLGDVGTSLASLGNSASGSGSKASKLAEVMKALREEIDRLRATIGMTDLQKAIWDKQREAGVTAASEAGKYIAAQMQILNQLKEVEAATDRGRDAFSNLFGSIRDGAAAAQNALANLLREMAKVQFQKGMLGLLGSTSWGSKLIAGVGSMLGSNATGTDYWRGGLTAVNERGGEIMNLPRGTQIIPHDLSKRMIDRSGGGRSEVTIKPSPLLEAVVERVARGAAVQAARVEAVGLRREIPALMSDNHRRRVV